MFGRLLEWRPVYFDRDELRRGFEADPYADEDRPIMSRGWLVKAKFPDSKDFFPPFGWFEVPVGNCRVCRYLPQVGGHGQVCQHPKVSLKRYIGYLQTNTCPYFEIGFHARRSWYFDDGHRWEDALKAAGFLPGEPSQRVEVLQKVPWTPWRAYQALNQQRHYLHLARAKDAGDKFDSYESGDPNDDLGPIDTSE